MPHVSEVNYSELHREGSRVARFGGVGVANTIVDFAVYAGLIAAGVTPLAANGAGFVVANAQSYVLNSWLTFNNQGAAPLSVVGYGRFLIAHLLSLIISTAMIWFLADKFGALAAKAAAMGFTFIWNYATSAIFVFKSRGQR